ncbi:FG-GAP and VCBS repeat-containing protein [Streptomyces sp. NBC_01304]|uniref:FG-GAP and VCBS repeat-containing protein n=1 Tax=Streptomyces sp. NBC_01304 TaxID=2903818 RepID=UPI002E15B2BE|nr:VCBS repeat-containing protein [Streptomyces sp. NBC_01304]
MNRRTPRRSVAVLAAALLAGTACEAAPGGSSPGKGATAAASPQQTRHIEPMAPGTAPAVRPPAEHRVTTPDSDFNGDGLQDAVLAAPQANTVVIVYGDRKGAGPDRRQVLTNKSSGVPKAGVDPASGPLSRFGGRSVAGDLDSDGYADLVLASHYENAVDGAEAWYSIAVVWGSPSGLGRSRPGLLLRHSGTGEAPFGVELALCDFNGDRSLDLATTAGNHVLRVLPGPITMRGTRRPVTLKEHGVGLAAGDVNGDGRCDLVVGGNTVYAGTPRGYLRQVKKLDNGTPSQSVIGDVNGDGYGDLIVGSTATFTPARDDRRPDPAGGRIAVHPGSRDGLSRKSAQIFHQGTPGVPGAPEPADDAGTRDGDDFGARLAVGDCDRDGRTDIAIGSPDESLGSVEAAGAVIVLHGSRNGLTVAGVQAINHNTPGVPGKLKAGDHFGTSLRLLDVTGDGRAELFAGTPFENRREPGNYRLEDRGGVYYFPATAQGTLTTTGSWTHGPQAFGVPKVPAEHGNEHFGYDLGR